MKIKRKSNDALILLFTKERRNIFENNKINQRKTRADNFKYFLFAFAFKSGKKKIEFC